MHSLIIVEWSRANHLNSLTSEVQNQIYNLPPIRDLLKKLFFVANFTGWTERKMAHQENDIC